jgi:hypothetical protein
MTIVAKYTRTLPAPSATISGGFVFVLSAAWFSQADQGAAGSPIDGGTNSLANGGGDIQIFSDTATTTRLPIDVVTFVTGGSPVAQVWVRTTSYTSGDTITIGKDGTQTTQPAFGASFGRNATWVDFYVVTHDGVTDSTGNTTLTSSNTATGAIFNGINSVRFNGTSTRIDALLASLPIPFSLSMWCDFDVLGDTAMSVADKDVTNQFHRMVTSSSVNTLQTQSFDGTAVRTADSGVNPLSGGFRYCLSSFSSAFLRMASVDASIQSTNNNTSTVLGVDRLTIGTDADSTPFSWLDGDATSFKVHSTAVSQNESESYFDNQSDPDNFGTSSEWVLVGGGGISVTVPSIPSEESFGTPSITLSTTFISPVSIPSAEAFGLPGVILTTEFISPISITSQESFGIPVILSAAIIVTPTSITSEESFGMPVLLFDQAVLVQSIPSGESFGIPIISDGQAIIIPVEFRGTSNKVAEYLNSTGRFTSEQVNDIIIEWLKLENTQGETFNDLFYNYWQTKGFTGTYPDKQDKWRNE